jgi:hypothetical protein
MPSGTNLEKKRAKLERLCRRAFHGLDSIHYVTLAQCYRGGASSIFCGNALIRDILKTLDELDELKARPG